MSNLAAPRPLRRLRVAFAGCLGAALLALAPTAHAADSQWAIAWDSPQQHTDAERVLDSLEKAYDSAIKGSTPSPQLQQAANRLVNTRIVHARLLEDFAKATQAVEEAKARLEKDTRIISERHGGEAWAKLPAAEQDAMRAREAAYIKRIELVTGQRKAAAQRTEDEKHRAEVILKSYAASWGGLAIERVIATPRSRLHLSGVSWERAMERHAGRFNPYVSTHFAACPYLAATPSRPLRSFSDTPAPRVERKTPAPMRAGGWPDGPAAPNGSTRGPSTVDGGPSIGTPADEPIFLDEPDTRPRADDALRGNDLSDNDLRGEGPGYDELESPAPVRTSAPTESYGGFTWHLTFAGAQAEARRTGKAIFCLSTKPKCHLCDKIKTDAVPGALRAMQAKSVGYLYQILDPEDREVDKALRANLPTARMMPLAGWLTPERGWITGFWGLKTAGDMQQFLQQIR